MEPTNKFVDINLGNERTQIRINGRNDSILELDLTDLGIADRLQKGYVKLQASVESIKNLSAEDEKLSEKLNEADKQMREAIDYIFDSNVSEVCCPSGTMFDPKDGEYKFERILNALLKLYDESITTEFNKMKKRVAEEVGKYMPQDHKKKISKATKKMIKEAIDEIPLTEDDE